MEGSNAMYCTAGLGLPIPVLTGYYSVGGDLNTRIDVVPCPLGSYCKGGVCLYPYLAVCVHLYHTSFYYARYLVFDGATYVCIGDP